MESLTEQQPAIYKWMKRIAGNGKIAHAYLFSGPKGAGKLYAAQYFAQLLNCQEAQRPCQQCRHCVRIAHRNHPDVHHLQADGASIKIDQIRQLQKQFALRAHESAHQLYIVEQADQMTVQAANSVLKFLEEPHSGIVAILLAEQRQLLLSTIISRCQEIAFPAPSPSAVVHLIEEQCETDGARLAAYLTGDVQTAVQLCQTEWFAPLQSIVIQLIQHIPNRSAAAWMLIGDEWLSVAAEKAMLEVGLDLCILVLKDMVYLAMGMPDKVVWEAKVRLLREQQQRWNQYDIAAAIEAVLIAKKHLHANGNGELVLEQLVFTLQAIYHSSS